MPRPKAKIEDSLVLAFLKSVGVETGFYNPAAKTFKTGIEDEPLYQSNLEIIRQALKNGWTATELEDFIFRRYEKGERAALLSDILPKKDPSKKFHEDDNLIQEGVAYFHPNLRISIMPVYTPDGLVCVSSGKSTSKSSFSLKDLVQYYFSKMRVGNTPRNWTQAVGAFQWLLQGAPVDVLLTAVDIAEDRNDETPPLKLQDYVAEAEREVAHRRAMSV